MDTMQWFGIKVATPTGGTSWTLMYTSIAAAHDYYDLITKNAVDHRIPTEATLYSWTGSAWSLTSTSRTG